MTDWSTCWLADLTDWPICLTDWLTDLETTIFDFEGSTSTLTPSWVQRGMPLLSPLCRSWIGGVCWSAMRLKEGAIAEGRMKEVPLRIIVPRMNPNERAILNVTLCENKRMIPGLRWLIAVLRLENSALNASVFSSFTTQAKRCG